MKNEIFKIQQYRPDVHMLNILFQADKRLST